MQLLNNLYKLAQSSYMKKTLFPAVSYFL